MKKLQPKTKLARFILENYKSARALSRSLNDFCGYDIAPVGNGGNMIKSWASGREKPQLRKDVWFMLQKFFNVKHNIRLDEKWIAPVSEKIKEAKQSEIQFREKLDFRTTQLLVHEYENLDHLCRIFDTPSGTSLRGIDLPNITGLQDRQQTLRIFPNTKFGQELKTAVGTLLCDMICNRMDEIKKQLQCN